MPVSYNIGVRVLLDADALIKLRRAGVLEHIARTFDCIIPQAVYHEVVTRGREFKYPDAEEIDRIIQVGIVVEPPAEEAPDISEAAGADAGERGLLALFHSFPAGEDLTIVSDDRRFLAQLAHLEIPALIPSDFIVLMVRQGFLARGEASNALERMRPLIRETAYQQAVRNLEE